MSVFKDADEVDTYIGKMFEGLLGDPQFTAATAKSGLVIRLNCSDPDTTMLVDFPGQSVSYGQDAVDAPNATVDLHMTSDDAHRFWLGKLSFPAAMARKRLTMEGSTSKALKLLPLTKTLFAAYEQLLRDSGRDDLIEKA